MTLGLVLAGVAGLVSLGAGLLTALRHRRMKTPESGLQPQTTRILGQEGEVVISEGLMTAWQDKEGSARLP
jgi:hypothetical protein